MQQPQWLLGLGEMGLIQREVGGVQGLEQG